MSVRLFMYPSRGLRLLCVDLVMRFLPHLHLSALLPLRYVGREILARNCFSAKNADRRAI